MKRIFALIFFLIILVSGLGFAVINADPVTLNYYLGTVSAPLSLILVAAMTVGAVLGVLATIGMMLSLKREVSKLRRTVRLKEEEVSNLRSIPIRDEH